MAHIVKMPKLSDTMTEGVIVKWNKKVGDKVKSGDILAEIETDKATMEFESFYDGVLLHIGVPEKKAVPVDAVIAIIGKEGEDITALLNNSNGTSTTTPATEKKSETPTTSSANNISIPPTVHIVKMPKLSDTMTEGVVAKWNKKVGDKVKSGDILAEIETDKATMEFESFYDGVLLHIGVQEKQSAAVDSLLAIIGKGNEDVNAILAAIKTSDSVSAASQSVVKTETATETAAGHTNMEVSTVSTGLSTGKVKASPLAKRLAKEKGIDLSLVQGSGDNGRIIRRDIENFKAPSIPASVNAIGGAGVGQLKEAFRDEELTQMRKTIARRLTESKNSAPHYYLTIDVDMDNAISFRTMANENADIKISFNDIIIKAVAVALRNHPKVNCSWLGDKIRYYDHIHIGVAVAIEDGLIVPVIRFADQKSILQISAESKELSKKAKERKLQPKDWEGNTFTVSNLGMFGISQFTSIINSPESCILSVGAIRSVPVVKNNQVVPGNVMTLTMACDHRTVDGATGAAFLQTLKNYLENPVRMLL